MRPKMRWICMAAVQQRACRSRRSHNPPMKTGSARQTFRSAPTGVTPGASAEGGATLIGMSMRKSGVLILVTAIAAWAMLPIAVSAGATSLADQTAADRAALAQAVQRYDEAESKAAQLDARVRESSVELDRLVAEQARCQAQLRARVSAMYRSSDDGTLGLLLSASTIQDLAVRLDLIEGIAG